MARAQSDATTPVTADFKGAVGLGLVGAELGAVVPALAGVDSTWAYIVFPAIGAAGGALGGYFAIDHAGHAELSVAALTLGMALVIPALVITLSATAYDPGDEASVDPPRRVAAAQPSSGRASRRAQALARAARRASAGPGMLRLSDGELALAAPGIAVVPGGARGPVVSGLGLSLMSGRF